MTQSTLILNDKKFTLMQKTVIRFLMMFGKIPTFSVKYCGRLFTHVI